MLDIAIKYKEQLTEKVRDTWFREKYQFWNCTNFYEECQLADSTWNNHQFVSVDDSGEVIGYIGYQIDRANDVVYSLNIINFSDNKVLFGLDAGRALRDIFEKFHFRKLTFSVVVGNPIESTYYRLIQKYGGYVSGYQREQIRLMDGNFYDEKLYEVLAVDYFRARAGL